MLYLLYKIGIFILRITSVEVAYSIISFITKLKYLFSIKDKEIVKANLRVVMPESTEEEISALARDVFKNFGKYLVSFFSLIKNENGYLEKSVEIIGLENIDEALKLGKGCIVVTGHFGNWELAGCALANLGYKLNAIALAHTDPRINKLFIEQRKRAGANVIHIGNAKTTCQKALSRGEIVAILGDRPFGDHGIKVDFFGKTAVFPRGTALFSLKNGSPIITTFTYKENTESNTYKLIFEKPFLVKREGSLEEQLKTITKKFIDRFEYHIKKYPSQWYMFNKVWVE